MLEFFLYFLPIGLVVYAISLLIEKKPIIYNKNILVIGGSNGLGYSLSKFLANSGNKVISTSRDPEVVKKLNGYLSITYMVLDVNNKATFEKEGTKHDVIFYCSGLSIPGYFDQRTEKDYTSSINTNFLGMIRVLKHYSKSNKKPFHFVMVGSTLSLIQLQGYSTYSPTKSAMLSFFYSTYDEFKEKKIYLHLFNPSNMKTKGYENENRVKPKYTYFMDTFFKPKNPDFCAEYLINNMFNRKIVVMDIFTYFIQIRHRCERLIDYFLFPISIVFVFVARLMTKIIYKYRISD